MGPRSMACQEHDASHVMESAIVIVIATDMATVRTIISMRPRRRAIARAGVRRTRMNMSRESYLESESDDFRK
jgi:hypothetical protein